MCAPVITRRGDCRLESTLRAPLARLSPLTFGRFPRRSKLIVTRSFPGRNNCCASREVEELDD